MGQLARGCSVGSSLGLSETELRDKLGQFYAEFIGKWEVAVNRASANTDDIAVSERLVGGKLRLMRACRHAVFQSRPQAGFIDTWALCVCSCSISWKQTPEPRISVKAKPIFWRPLGDYRAI